MQVNVFFFHFIVRMKLIQMHYYTYCDKRHCLSFFAFIYKTIKHIFVTSTLKALNKIDNKITLSE